jgi:hypothetical protein
VRIAAQRTQHSIWQTLSRALANPFTQQAYLGVRGHILRGLEQLIGGCGEDQQLPSQGPWLKSQLLGLHNKLRYMGKTKYELLALQ